MHGGKADDRLWVDLSTITGSQSAGAILQYSPAGELYGHAYKLSPYIWINWTPSGRQSSLDMAFNLGWPKFALFKRMRAALGEHAYSRAADEMVNSNWYKQVGTRPEAPVGMMRSGEWPADVLNMLLAWCAFLWWE